jgi:adenosylcobinamide-GDP ribazoletransferase
MAGSAKEVVADIGRAVRFCSRLPVPALPSEREPHGPPEIGALTRVMPLAGLVIGAIPALVLAAALALRLGPFVSATFAVATLTIVTGAFHEDGLADAADGLFGGATLEGRLAIMKDSRIGAFGACALILAFALRIGAVAALASRLPTGGAVAALLAAASLSRTAALMPLALLPPARAEGASAAVGRPDREAMRAAFVLALALTVALGLGAKLPPLALVVMPAFAALAGLGVTRLAERLIGGQTGDIAGAAQQMAEIAALIGLLAAIEP